MGGAGSGGHHATRAGGDYLTAMRPLPAAALVAVLLPPLAACAHGPRIPPRTLAAALAEHPDAYVVVDVRSDGEWAGAPGHIPGATHLAWPGVKERAAEIEARPDQTVVLVCLSGHRSQWAWESVRAAVPGKLADLRGGMVGWWAAGLPTEREPHAPGGEPPSDAPPAP